MNDVNLDLDEEMRELEAEMEQLDVEIRAMRICHNPASV